MTFGRPKRPVINKQLTLPYTCYICEHNWEQTYIGSYAEPDPPQPPCPNCGMLPAIVPHDDPETTHYWEGPAQCYLCDYKWRAIVEVPAGVSYPLVSLECSQCGGMTGMPAEVFHDNQP